MSFLARRLLVAAVILCGLAAPAGAQFRPAPSSPAPPSSSPAVANISPGVAGYNSYAPPPSAPGYAPYPYPVQYNGRYGGYLSGAADLVNAQGDFLKSSQQSRLTGQQVEQSKMDTRRKIFDEWKYEQANTPTLEEQREMTMQQELQRSRNNPPLTEIWSGKALNDLLLAVQKMQNLNVRGPVVPLAPDVVQRIEVTSGATYGGLGVFKQPDRLLWPLVLRGAAYESERKQIDDLAPKAVQGATSGTLDADTVNQMTAAVDSLGSRLRQNVSSMTPDQYIQSKRFLNELTSGIQVLQDPMAASYVNQKWSAKGHDVASLIAEMTRQGLRFAPAVAGDQAAYVALHSALVAYDTGLAQQCRLIAER